MPVRGRLRMRAVFEACLPPRCRRRERLGLWRPSGSPRLRPSRSSRLSLAAVCAAPFPLPPPLIVGSFWGSSACVLPSAAVAFRALTSWGICGISGTTVSWGCTPYALPVSWHVLPSDASALPFAAPPPSAFRFLRRAVVIPRIAAPRTAHRTMTSSVGSGMRMMSVLPLSLLSVAAAAAFAVSILSCLSGRDGIPGSGAMSAG